MKKGTPKIHHYGIWITLCFILNFFLPSLLASFLDGFIVQLIGYIVIVTLFVLSLRQSYRLKKDKQIIDTYEKQNNAPLMHSVISCSGIYLMLCFFSLILAGFFASISTMISGVIVISALGLGWIPGLVLFIKDQKKLYQYKKNHKCSENFWVRMVGFLCGYLFVIFVVLSVTHMIYEFVSVH